MAPVSNNLLLSKETGTVVKLDVLVQYRRRTVRLGVVPSNDIEFLRGPSTVVFIFVDHGLV